MDSSQKFARLEWLYDYAIRTHPRTLFWFVGFMLSDGQENRDAGGGCRPFDLFANFQPCVSRHVNVQDAKVRTGLGQLLDGSRAIAYRDNFIAGVRQYLLAHVLGSHTVVSQ